MQLKVSRNQKKGVIGGIKFELYCQLDCSSEERSAISQYGLGNITMYENRKVEGSGLIGAVAKGVMNKRMTIGSMMHGERLVCTGIGEMLNTEQHIISMCQSAKATVEAAMTFGGEEIIAL